MITRSQGDFSLLEVIDRILDKGLVVNGDITLAIAGTDFLSLKINLVIASLETAKRYGIQLPWEKWEEEKRATESQVGTPDNLPYGNVPLYEENGNSEPMADQQQAVQYQTNNEIRQPQQAPAQATRRRKKRSGQRR